MPDEVQRPMAQADSIAAVSGLERWHQRLVTARRLFFSSRAAMTGVPLIAIVSIAAILAPVISPSDPFKQDLDKTMQPPVWSAGGTLSMPLGADHLGRDMLSRIMRGGRVSLMVGVSVVLLSAAIGVPLGLLSGYMRGVVDETIMALVDVWLAFPFLLLALLVVFLLGTDVRNVIIALGLAGWVTYARVVRADVLSLREREFVIAARAMGAGQARIILVHVLPQIVTPVIIVATLHMGVVILAEAGLSFLGLGVQPPTPTWGNMLAEGREYVLNAWWYATFPGLAIMITVLGFNTVGDWLRDIFDPRSRLRNI